MNTLLNEPRKIFAFLIWILWIPVILFCTHLLISGRNGSIFSFFLVSLTLLCTLLSIRWLSKYLDNISGAATHTANRIRKQFFYGFLVPLWIFIILAAAYDKFIDDNAIQQIHIIKELSIISMFFYLANSFYVVIYFDRQFLRATVKTEETEHYDEKVLVYHKGVYEPINLMGIALIYQLGQINWLITFEEEQHILDLSLKAIQEILSEKHFFKINRSQIVHKDAVSKFSAGRYGKIDIVLKVNGITSTVSKDRARDFRKWFYK